MKIETLKELIKKAYKHTENKGEFMDAVLELIDLYEIDQDHEITYTPFPYSEHPKTITTYGDICSCNPKNGGSGICGCTIGNKVIGGDWTTTITSNNVETKTS